MEYRWHQMEQQWWFHLSETAPYAVGAGLHELWTEQLRQGLPLELVRHIVMHTGGQTVIDAATAALGLDLPERLVGDVEVRRLHVLREVVHVRPSSVQLVEAASHLVEHARHAAVVAEREERVGLPDGLRRADARLEAVGVPVRELDLRADARQVALHVREGHVAAEEQPARQVARVPRVDAQQLRVRARLYLYY